MEHSHDFDDADWPFNLPTNTTVFSTKNVVHRDFPICTIAHDHEGDWQFLCGETDDPDDMSIVCMGCMFEMHPMIAQFHDLPAGWLAWRNDEEDKWTLEPLDEEE